MHQLTDVSRHLALDPIIYAPTLVLQKNQGIGIIPFRFRHDHNSLPPRRNHPHDS